MSEKVTDTSGWSIVCDTRADEGRFEQEVTELLKVRPRLGKRMSLRLILLGLRQESRAGWRSRRDAQRPADQPANRLCSRMVNTRPEACNGYDPDPRSRTAVGRQRCSRACGAKGDFDE